MLFIKFVTLCNITAIVYTTILYIKINFQIFAKID